MSNPITLSNASQSLLGIPVAPIAAGARQDATQSTEAPVNPQDGRQTVVGQSDTANQQSLAPGATAGRESAFATTLRNLGATLGVPNAANLIIEKMQAFKERTGTSALQVANASDTGTDTAYGNAGNDAVKSGETAYKPSNGNFDQARADLAWAKANPDDLTKYMAQNAQRIETLGMPQRDGVVDLSAERLAERSRLQQENRKLGILANPTMTDDAKVNGVASIYAENDMSKARTEASRTEGIGLGNPTGTSTGRQPQPNLLSGVGTALTGAYVGESADAKGAVTAAPFTGGASVGNALDGPQQ